MDPVRRRAALIATAVSLPVAVVAALVIGNASASPDDGKTSANSPAPLPAITVAAPPQSAADDDACTKVLAGLPVQLGDLDPRTVVSDPSSPYVVGWGQPAVVLRCGVERPADFTPTSLPILIGNEAGTGGVYFNVTSTKSANVYTAIDRAVYIEITEPAGYNAAQMPALAAVIAKALPPVCEGDGSKVGAKNLCAERK